MLNLPSYQILIHLYESSSSIIYRGIREEEFSILQFLIEMIVVTDSPVSGNQP
jgi:hypothetical protein